MHDVRSRIRGFITGRFPQAALGDDDDIFELGFVSSLFAIELVIFIEGTFGIVIANEDLTLDNLRSLSSMAALVDRSTAAAPERRGA
jgi:methoxymalonate biosynthesis acyl carrier protein